MPKRKAATALSAATESNDEDMMQANGSGKASTRDNKRPAKKQRGRPRSKSAEMKPLISSTQDPATAPPELSDAPAAKRGGRRGRPKGSRNSVQASQDVAEEQDETKESEHETDAQEQENVLVSNNELEWPQSAPKPTKSKPAVTRGRRKVNRENSLQADSEFEYTPSTNRRRKSTEAPEEQSAQPKKQKRRAEEMDTQEDEPAAQDVVDETMLQDTQPPSIPRSPAKRGQPQKPVHSSPLKSRLSGAEDKANIEPELRRRIGELTKKCDTLENRYRNLREIGVVEANTNMEKLRKQFDLMATASNTVIASLKAELEAQRALGQQSRSLQKQLKERDAEVTKLKSQAEETTGQLSSAQVEVKALQTKLAAARNATATASLESAAAKVPGSAIKSGLNRANAAVTAEAAQAAQFAQLKEDLYTDLTGLIIRDVKKRQSDNLYDCIQTGSNGTLHFKLVVPHVSSANFESAEFQYIPLLDENRDRDLVDILPEYLTVDITFVRQQASKFYTRVIDVLTKRRSTAAM
ncbi:putative chromosome segregation protein [Aspergillus heteromorphus CBS 117.55]|uniref:Putative chromosome segregation protein n=1 Tax=Aspergillus heteromorphus CBS 117.55 TaxID=1448321 RepID=A0A317W3C8_9EURO|nr:putative chromosome segregation protein [Aspergillus heteromorphus CBS 117.55]PWY80515.1 putative chromosome segregation protein [Aspergillus heteromorphus CBS 117.55]